MKTTILTIALALATMPLTFAAQTPAPAATSKPAVAAPVKTTKKHHVKAAAKTPKTVKTVKNVKNVKTAPASTVPAPVKQ
jgi:hypothetical protein